MDDCEAPRYGFAFKSKTFCLVSMEELLVDVGPELFEGEVGGVDEVAGEPLLADLGPGAVVGGVVEGRDACCGA